MESSGAPRLRLGAPLDSISCQLDLLGTDDYIVTEHIAHPCCPLHNELPPLYEQCKLHTFPSLWTLHTANIIHVVCSETCQQAGPKLCTLPHAQGGEHQCTVEVIS